MNFLSRTILYDRKRPKFFQRADMVEAAWRVVAPIQNVWSALEPRDFPNYPAGTWGPDAANELLTRDGRNWWVWPLRTQNTSAQ